MDLSQNVLHPKDQEERYKTRTQRTLDELVPISKKITLLIHAASNRDGLAGLTIGMELEDTKQHMGERTRTGSSGYFTNIVLENPHWHMIFFNKKEEKIEKLPKKVRQTYLKMMIFGWSGLTPLKPLVIMVREQSGVSRQDRAKTTSINIQAMAKVFTWWWWKT